MSLKKLKRSIEQMPRCAYIFLKGLLALAALMLSASLLLFLTADRSALAEKTLARLEKVAGFGADKVLNNNTKETPDVLIGDGSLSEAVDREIMQMESVTLSFADDRILEDLANNDSLLKELTILTADITTLEPLLRCRKLETVYLPLSAFPLEIPENAQFEVILRQP